ncbi:MAG: hypothetical protein AB7S75_02795 [Desulfococcaceae bacterium]
MSEFDILLKAVSIGLKAGLKAFAEGTEPVQKQADETAKPRRKSKKETAVTVKEQEKTADEPVKKTRKKRTLRKTAKPGRKKTAGRKRRGGVSDTDAVLEVILAAENGIDQDELAEKSGFPRSKVHGIVYRLKKQGKIRSIRKGFYEKI